MASQQTARDIPHTGQPQPVYDAVMQEALDKMANDFNAQPAQDDNASLTSQATHLMQQTGEQVKNMAEGAADAVKNTLGMNTNNTNTAAPTEAGATATQPSRLTAENPSNPTNNNINISTTKP